ncbi:MULTISPECIES: hypothetical protein [Burkholderia cepacia complex]|uniref:hypothetical protein n=1 Tax=Burkholderia cenocepacia TaxID=95486 RepID=UPI0022375792|nr:hypothetical protein [Burkholderia cenocepacia]MCW5156412.1 hypothetical protein [Burkholderia cenocepacia]
MKKILLAAALVATTMTAAQACEIESHLKWCVEVGHYNNTTQEVQVDGQPSSDFKTSVNYDSYLKITYTKPISYDIHGFLVVKDKSSGKEMFRRPVSVTTKVINDGSSIPKGMANFLDKLK